MMPSCLTLIVLSWYGQSTFHVCVTEQFIYNVPCNRTVALEWIQVQMIMVFFKKPLLTSFPITIYMGVPSVNIDLFHPFVILLTSC